MAQRNPYYGHQLQGIDFLYIYLGDKISKRLVNTSITPNQITLIEFFMAIIATVLYLTGSYPAYVIAAILLQMNLVTDRIDGNLAKRRKQMSKVSAWFDNNIGTLGDTLIIWAIAIGLFRIQGNYHFIYLGGVVVSIRLLIKVMFSLTRKNNDMYTALVAEGEQKLGFLRNFYYSHVFMFAVATICSIINKLEWFLYICAIYGTLFYIAYFIISFIKMSRFENKG